MVRKSTQFCSDWVFLWEKQWCNRQGGRVPTSPPPRDFWPGNFCWPTGKRKTRKKDKEKENRKREGGKLKRKSYKKSRGLFFFHFSKPLKFVLGLPKWEFSTKKKHFTPGKNQEKWLCPLWKIFLLHPWREVLEKASEFHTVGCFYKIIIFQPTDPSFS